MIKATKIGILVGVSLLQGALFGMQPDAQAAPRRHIQMDNIRVTFPANVPCSVTEEVVTKTEGLVTKKVFYSVLQIGGEQSVASNQDQRQTDTTNKRKRMSGEIDGLIEKIKKANRKKELEELQKAEREIRQKSLVTLCNNTALEIARHTGSRMVAQLQPMPQN